MVAIQGGSANEWSFANKKEATNNDGSTTTCHRYVSFEDAPDPSQLVQSMTDVYTMFPQMPYPMPLPTTSPEELEEDIANQGTRMAESGIDPHKDMQW